MHIHADVIALMAGRLPGMQAHSYPHVCTVGPIVRGKPALSRQRSSDRIGCRGEDDEEAVSPSPDLRAMPARDLFTHDGALNGERFAVVHAQLGEQPGRTLDVTEHQGERPRARRLLHQLSMTTQPRC